MRQIALRLLSALLSNGPEMLKRHVGGWLYALVRSGAPPGTRTPNPRIKSPLLCQLS
jgi:hypothetical protein